MEDFFKQFKENMENRPEPQFEERDWVDMEKRLDRLGRKPRAAFAWWWLALPLMLLISNTFFFLEWQNSQRQFSMPELNRDTVFQTKMIYLTDTVYRTRTVYKQTKMNPLRADEGFFHNSRVEVSPYSSWKFGLLKSASKLPDDSIEEASIGISQKMATLTQPELQLFSQGAKTLPVPPAEPEISDRKKTLRHYLHAMRPEGYHLGVTGGWAYPLFDGLRGISGYSAGLEAAVEFSPNFRLWANVVCLKTSFETSRMDDASGVPAVDPPTPGYSFVVAEIPQLSLQYAAGLQYIFNAGKKFKPYFGAGYCAITSFSYEITYDFYNPSLGIEWIFEKSVGKHETLGKFLLMKAGFEQEISGQWRWHLAATYRRSLENLGFQSTAILGIQSGLAFRF
jgi:hypothetical protein